MKQDINQFTIGSGEKLHEAWDRFKDMLRKCPQHGPSKAQYIIIFYNALDCDSRVLLDASLNGAFLTMTPIEAEKLFENILMNSRDWPIDRVFANLYDFIKSYRT